MERAAQNIIKEVLGLQCPICIQPYQKSNPAYLACLNQHNMCKECLTTIIQKKKKQQIKESQLPQCPQCRQPIIVELIIDRNTMLILEIHDTIKKQKNCNEESQIKHQIQKVWMVLKDKQSNLQDLKEVNKKQNEQLQFLEQQNKKLKNDRQQLYESSDSPIQLKRQIKHQKDINSQIRRQIGSYQKICEELDNKIKQITQNQQKKKLILKQQQQQQQRSILLFKQQSQIQQQKLLLSQTLQLQQQQIQQQQQRQQMNSSQTQQRKRANTSNHIPPPQNQPAQQLSKAMNWINKQTQFCYSWDNYLIKENWIQCLKFGVPPLYGDYTNIYTIKLSRLRQDIQIGFIGFQGKRRSLGIKDIYSINLNSYGKLKERVGDNPQKIIVSGHNSRIIQENAIVTVQMFPFKGVCKFEIKFNEKVIPLQVKLGKINYSWIPAVRMGQLDIITII